MMRLTKPVLLIIALTVGLFLSQVSSAQQFKENQPVSFNFVDVELPVLAKFVSETTGINIIFDERLRGKVTVIAPTPLKAKDAFSLFTSVLELKGYSLVQAGVNAYKIVPSQQARQGGLKLLEGRPPIDERHIIRLIPLKHISAQEAVRFLRPMVSRGGYITEFSRGNLVLVVDTALNTEKLVEIIKKIDQPTTVNLPEMVILKHSTASEIAKILNEGLKATRRTKGRVSNVSVVPYERLNAVVIFGEKSEVEALKRLIAMLDVPSEEAMGRVNVYFLENADADSLAKVLNGIISTMKKPQRTPRKATVPTLTGDVVITADPSTNALIIVASPSDYKNLVGVIKQLDRRKPQVYVEAMIVEASIDKLRDLGTRWRAMATKDGEPIVIGGVGQINPSAVESILYGLSGMTLGGLGNFIDVPVTRVNSDGTVTTTTLTVPGYAALFSLEEFRDAINILSTPQILTSDNEEAEIVVGENVPFITKKESNPSAATSVFTTIERKDVGITLKIKPHITEGDYVRLEIYQEISAVKQSPDTEVLISLGPTTTKRSTETTVVVKDNQTVVIGGLMQEKVEEIEDKVPLLGDIPLLGWLFKSKNIQRSKTNLLVFLTPHIIRDAEALRSLTEKKGRGYLSMKSDFEEPEKQILVKFKTDVEDTFVKALAEKLNARIAKSLPGVNIYVFELDDEEDIPKALETLKAEEAVEYAEPNRPVRIER
ncbi:MAG: type II secretion system protein GspD [Nitrospirae bacterium]|nr:MAG: type II secretion system protein GspD [Nitrospirota bacterium]